MFQPSTSWEYGSSNDVLLAMSCYRFVDTEIRMFHEIGGW
jgi:hypothetical protein